MKIQYLEIKNYKQFKDLKLDLTYPKGHEKAGEPLDKICIIGQSGTGKTNLLNLIKNYSLRYTDEVSSQEYMLVSKFKLFSDSICEIKIEKLDDNQRIKSEFIYHIDTNKNLSNSKKIDEWILIKDSAKTYKDKYSEYINKLTNKLVNIDNYSKEEYKKDLKIWEDENENILDNISNEINKTLNRFNLELAKIDENQTSYNDLVFKALSNEKLIKYDDLSTGTKNLISTFIPLKLHSPKDSIILIDEPEISFYPDIQTELTDLYMDIGTNNQLIMATHSPLIASSFEPWEIVELKFDKNNQIYREKYYDDENHIDNYTIDPRCLTWTSILTDIFNLKADSNFTFREEKLMEYIRLEKELKTIEDKNEKREKFEELMKRSELLGLSNNEKN